MTRRNVLVFAFALTSMLTFAGCRTAPQPEQKKDAAADIKAINTFFDQCIAVWNSNDAAATAATFANDAIVMT